MRKYNISHFFVQNTQLNWLLGPNLQKKTTVFENKKIQAAMLYCTCMWGLDPHGAGLGFLIPLVLQRAGWNKAYCNGGSHRMAAALTR